MCQKRNAALMKGFDKGSQRLRMTDGLISKCQEVCSRLRFLSYTLSSMKIGPARPALSTFGDIHRQEQGLSLDVARRSRFNAINVHTDLLARRVS